MHRRPASGGEDELFGFFPESRDGVKAAITDLYGLRRTFVFLIS
jgi:hypothetical protein